MVRKISEKRSGVEDLFAVLGGGVPIDAGEGCRRSAGCTGLCFRCRVALCCRPRAFTTGRARVSPRSLRVAGTAFGQGVVQRLMSLTVAAAGNPWP